MIEIKPYTAIYKNQIIELILEIQVNEFGMSISIDDQTDLDNIPDFYIKGNGNFWVALDGDRVIGTIALIDITNKQTALRKMFVHKDYRGKEKGVAKALLDELISWCKDINVQEIYLGTTSAFLAAHRFYEKYGFHEVSKSKLPSSFPVMEVDSKFYCYKL